MEVLARLEAGYNLDTIQIEPIMAI